MEQQSINMEQQSTLNFLNKATYARDDVIKFYRNADMLLEAESVLFTKLLPVIKNSKILDIGVGGGRTTNYILQISDDYTGVDYVAQFAEEVSLKFPNARILCADAADLTEIEDQIFDFVLFSYNGIDSVTHEKRLLVLKEIYRVLKTDGVFMFSSHNRDYRYFNKFPWQQKMHYSASHLIFLLHCLYHLPKHYKMKRHEIYADDYAIVNNGDHRFSLMLYYISITHQRKQLTDIGFSDIEVYDTEGQLVQTDTSSHWLHYLAKKR